MTSTPVKAFVDNMFLMSPSIPVTQVLLYHGAVAFGLGCLLEPLNLGLW